MSEWRRRLQPAQLAKQPACEICLSFDPDTPAPATVVDHIIPHKGDLTLFLDPENLQSSCKPCHDQLKRQVELNGYHSMMGADGFPLDPNHPFNRAR